MAASTWRNLRRGKRDIDAVQPPVASERLLRRGDIESQEIGRPASADAERLCTAADCTSTIA